MVQYSKERLETKGHTNVTYHCNTFQVLLSGNKIAVPKTEEKFAKKENKGCKCQQLI